MFSKLTILASLVLVLLAGCVRFEDKPLSAAVTAERLEARSLGNTNVKAFLETNLQHTFTEWPLTNWDFPALTLAAFYFHPALDVARAQWAVARGGETTAGARPNPVLGVTPGYSANAPQGVSPWFPSVTLDVPIETAGKRGYRLAHADALSQGARLNISVAAWQVRSGVRAALVEYAAVRQRAALLAANVALQQQLLETLQQRLDAGFMAPHEISLARLALLKLRGEFAEAQRLVTEARGKTAESLGLPLRALDGVEFAFDLNQVPDALLLSADARREALQGRADIRAALADYAASQSALQLEIARQYPDLHLNPGYQYDQGENKWTLGLSIELPVLYRNQGGIAEAQARRDESAAKFLALQVKVISEIDRALLLRQAALEQLRQIDEFAQAQREQLAQTESAFRAGGADRMELAQARIEAAGVALNHLDALWKKQQATGLLEDALQRPFDGLSTVERDPKLQAARDQ